MKEIEEMPIMLLVKRAEIDELLIGAHTSAQGGAFKALLEGKTIGATTVQLFTANQKQWKAKPLSEESIALFERAQKETGIRKVMSHAGYLINLGSPNEEGLQKSRTAFREEVERCFALNLNFLNFHPGAALDGPREAALDRVVQSLLELENLFVDDSLRLLLETTAGQGSSLGWRFEELGYILRRVKDKLPIGVCIDTCHVFVAGYDIRTPLGWKETLDEFEKHVGLQYLYAFHLNDSLCDLGSRKDRHEQLGSGKIGADCFKFLMTYAKTRELPKYLETPGGIEFWDKEIWMLREFAKGQHC
jgi:deoxyribonuclease-4